jgi:hypothetical protein
MRAMSDKENPKRIEAWPQGKREWLPNGLIAMAIVNILLAFYQGLGAVGSFTIVFLHGLTHAVSGGIGGTFVSIFAQAVIAIVALAAGVGYLKMTRWGYILGHVYAVSSILFTLVTIVSLGAGETMQGTSDVLHAESILRLVVYPVLTLVLLRWVFRQHFPDAVPGGN